jgi:hypothetical protein
MAIGDAAPNLNIEVTRSTRSRRQRSDRKLRCGNRPPGWSPDVTLAARMESSSRVDAMTVAPIGHQPKVMASPRTPSNPG